VKAIGDECRDKRSEVTVPLKIHCNISSNYCIYMIFIKIDSYQLFRFCGYGKLMGRLSTTTYKITARSARALALWFALLFVAFAPAHGQSVIQYTDATPATIVDNNCTTGLITKTINVPISYIVSDVDLGVRLLHTYRSDLRITLKSPAGPTVNVMLNVGGSGDNLHDRFDDEAAANISTHNATVTDPTTPTATPYSHSFKPTSPFSVFEGQNAAGNWIFTLCDSVGADVGTLNRIDLFITAAPAAINISKTSSIISDGVSGGNPKSIPGAVVSYCILITNTGPSAATNVAASDVIPATLTYIAGSMVSGTTCANAATAEDDNAASADESDPVGASISGATIAIVAPSLILNGSVAIKFEATIN
jgi:uncharacterized repeat protein (TIGR01451 family)